MKTLANKDAQLINDLIAINIDRIESYAHAVARLDTDRDADIISFLEKLGQQSQQFKSQLAPFAEQDDQTTGETFASQGTLYQHWSEQRTTLTTAERESVLQACDKEENLLKKVYEDVLSNVDGIDEKIVDMIKSQLKVQRESHQALNDLMAL